LEGNGFFSTRTHKFVGRRREGKLIVTSQLFLLFPEFKPEAWSRTIRCERAAFDELKRVHVSPFEKAADFGEGIDPLAEVAEVILSYRFTIGNRNQWVGLMDFVEPLGAIPERRIAAERDIPGYRTVHAGECVLSGSDDTEFPVKHSVHIL